MLKSTAKVSILLLSLFALPTLATAEAAPKQSRDYQGNYDYVLKNRKAKPEVAACSATAQDLTKNKKFKYDRFGFTQADFDAVKYAKGKHKKNSTIQLNGEARLRSSSIQWDKVTIHCAVKGNKIHTIEVTAKK